MIATWMLYGTVIAILAGVGALALERGARMLGRAGRWCWVGAVVVTLALPAVAWLHPLTPTRFPGAPVPSGAPDSLTLAIAPAAPVIPTHVAAPRSWSDFDRPLAYGWALLSLALIAWFVVGFWRLTQMRKSWRSENGLLVSENVGPAVVGFLRCEVVVPEWSLRLTPEQRDLLLAHEAEHLLTQDARLLLGAAALVALLPWNLGLWWHFRRLRLAIELDCDQRVLRRRPDPATYGQLLLDVGARAPRSFFPVPAFHEPPSSLEERIRHMTAKRPKRAGLLAGLTVVGAGVVTLLACEAPRPTAPATKIEASTFQTHEEEGRVISTFIGDSVRHYFGTQATQGPVYLWFIVSPDSHVVRYGTTPRPAPDDVIRSQEAPAVVPGFAFPKFQSITAVGMNTVGAGSQPIYWAVLRDPKRPVLPSGEGRMLALVPWVREAMEKSYPGLLAAKDGAPVEVWFVADSAHHVLLTRMVTPQALPGVALGPTTELGQVFPGLASGTITSITPGAAAGWGLDSVRVVWVMLPSVRR